MLTAIRSYHTRRFPSHVKTPGQGLLAPQRSVIH
jgi:hypothetical protein